jgi:outer membrane lipoprotein-sorting protein
MGPRAFVFVLLCALPLGVRAQQDGAPRPAQAQEGFETLEALLAGFKAMPGLYTKFREEKRMALLAAPLVNEGTLHYAPPQRVARHVLRPAPQTVLIDGTSVTMGDGRRTETVRLARNPVLKEFLDSFLLVLAGDRAALEKAYAVTFAPATPERPWSLSLKPRRSPMKDAIAEVAFVGRRLVIERMTIREVGGDHTVTTFSDADPARTYSAEEWKALFRLPKKEPR